jgi:hypothetical protein
MDHPPRGSFFPMIPPREMRAPTKLLQILVTEHFAQSTEPREVTRRVNIRCRSAAQCITDAEAQSMLKEDELWKTLTGLKPGIEVLFEQKSLSLPSDQRRTKINLLCALVPVLVQNGELQ